MAYFSNGTEGMLYLEDFCNHCVFQETSEGSCPIWDAHLRDNYEECNNPTSVLHMLIPRDGVENKQCRFFTRKSADGDLFEGVNVNAN